MTRSFFATSTTFTPDEPRPHSRMPATDMRMICPFAVMTTRLSAAPPGSSRATSGPAPIRRPSSTPSPNTTRRTASRRTARRSFSGTATTHGMKSRNAPGGGRIPKSSAFAPVFRSSNPDFRGQAPCHAWHGACPLFPDVLASVPGPSRDTRAPEDGLIVPCRRHPEGPRPVGADA